jgi:hypothetical protein
VALPLRFAFLCIQGLSQKPKEVGYILWCHETFEDVRFAWNMKCSKRGQMFVGKHFLKFLSLMTTTLSNLQRALLIGNSFVVIKNCVVTTWSCGLFGIKLAL